MKPSLPLNNKIKKFIFFIFIVILSNKLYANIEVIDDAGYVVSLDKPAQRVITLSPGLTELVYAAGGSEKIIATVSYSDFPEQAKSLPRIGNSNSLDIEQILILRPDLIIAWKSGNSVRQIEQLKNLNLKIYVSEPLKFSDIPDTIKVLGDLMSTQDLAQKNAQKFIKKYDELKQDYQKDLINTPKRTFIQIWDNPVMSVNSEHLISQVISFCGGYNIFSDALSLTYSPDIESILKQDPEIILSTQMDPSSSWLERWYQWPYLTAVKNDQLYNINPDHLVRHTPRILLGIETICQLIHSK